MNRHKIAATRPTLLVAGALALASGMEAQSSGGSGRRGNYAQVNGINLYYEIHGTGKPLVLLHGGLFSSDLWGPVLPALARGRQVIAVDLQGHGRTADIDRPIRHQLLAGDIAALIEQLRIGPADIMGYSFGGGVALHVAAQHPDLVDRLVLVSIPFRRNGFYADMIAQQAQVGAAMADAMRSTPIYENYSRVAPRPQDFPRLLDKMGDMMRQDYDYTPDIARIRAATLIVAADADMFPPSHAAEFFALLGGGQRDAGWDGSARPRSRLAMLPGLTHYNIGSNPALAAAVIPFLDDSTTMRRGN